MRTCLRHSDSVWVTQRGGEARERMRILNLDSTCRYSAAEEEKSPQKVSSDDGFTTEAPHHCLHFTHFTIINHGKASVCVCVCVCVSALSDDVHN